MLLALLLTATPLPISGTSLHFLGWSQDARRIALLHYYEGQTINHSCVLRVFVQDLVTDEIEWELKKTWGEDARDGSDDCPKNLAAAWKRVAIEADAALTARQISGSKAPVVQPLPAGEINAVLEGEAVVATSPKGKKTLAKSAGSTCRDASITGYIKTPDAKRIAIVVKTEDDLDWCPYDVLVGCGTKTGFK